MSFGTLFLLTSLISQNSFLVIVFDVQTLDRSENGFFAALTQLGVCFYSTLFLLTFLPFNFLFLLTSSSEAHLAQAVAPALPDFSAS